MNAISVAQPKALLLAHGYSSLLVRQYDADHRGWFAIHAAATLPDDYFETMKVFPYMDCVRRLNLGESWTAGTDGPRRGVYFPPEAYVNDDWIAGALPRNKIVGVAWLAKTQRVKGIVERWNRREDQWKLDNPDYADVPCWEPTFTDVTDGGFAWWLCRPMALRRPIATDGTNGWWSTLNQQGLDEEIRADLASQGLAMTDPFQDPAFWRTVNRRGETDATRPLERNI